MSLSPALVHLVEFGAVIAAAGTIIHLGQSISTPPAPPKLPPSGGFGLTGGGIGPGQLIGFGNQGPESSGLGGAVASWFATLPPNAGPAREAAILGAYNAGFTRSSTWSTIRSTAAGHTLDLDVMDDCLAVGDDTDWIRVSMSPRTQQAIADGWPSPGVYLCTSKIADLIAINAVVRIAPQIMSARKDIGTDHMSETWVMAEYQKQIEAARQGRLGLLSDAGKFWVASPRLGSAASPAKLADGQLASANYGFFVLDASGNLAPRGPVGSHVGTGGWSHGPGGLAVWQNVGLAHNLDHADYSQTCRLVGRRAVLDGTTDVDLQTIASDPALCALVSDEGPVTLRIPAIPAGQPGA